MLITPESIRELQKKLYCKAKQQRAFRFYALYDKVYRADIVAHAYRLVRSNKGAPGIDGIDFVSIEGAEGGAEKYCAQIIEELRDKTYRPMPVKRVYIAKPGGGERPLGIPTIKDRIVQMAVKIIIEPIFEADFQGSSYGFRPKRNAHQAMDEITLQLRRKNTQVIDADISRYFDTIAHDKLLAAVAKRIVDKNILRLLKMWLKAPVVEEEGEKSTYRRNEKGTPQGGVISPLLANIYLNDFDIAMQATRLVRYCDDFVILCKQEVRKTYDKMADILREKGLTLHPEKTRIIDATETGFSFLGFDVQSRKSYRTGKAFPMIAPSKRATAAIRSEIKEVTSRKNLALPKEIVVRILNEKVRGWTGYFHYGNSSKAFVHLRHYLEERVRGYLRRKHRIKGRGYVKFPNAYLYGNLGLYKIPTTAPWTQANACGRR